MPRTWRAVENRTGDNGEAASTEGVVHELESHHDQAIVHLPILPAGCQAPRDKFSEAATIFMRKREEASVVVTCSTG